MSADVVPATPSGGGTRVLQRPRKVLFVLDHPSFLKELDTTIPELLRRGHRIEVEYGDPTKSNPQGIGIADERVHVSDVPVPRRRDRHNMLAAWTRANADYLQYLTPELVSADFARERAGRHLLVSPRLRRRVGTRRAITRIERSALLRALETIDESLPPVPEIEQDLRARGPDILVISPLLGKGYQADYIHSAHRLGIPTVVCVASWDNLTSKGRLRPIPDIVTVWNERQADELARFHEIPRERIRVTGAQQFDRWFGRQPSTGRAEFAARHGLPPDRPYLLFVGSTNQLRAHEAEASYVRAWLQALRGSEHAVVREMPVLIRPHPKTATLWQDVELADPLATIWRRDATFPIRAEERAAYFDGLHHSAAVVGINTTAMIEAAIVGRPVHTICLPEWRAMQHDLAHFHYLLKENGGFLRTADSLDEHLRLLATDLAGPEHWRPDQLRFVRSFFRPHGMDQPAVTHLADTIESGRRQRAWRPRVPRAMVSHLADRIVRHHERTVPPQEWRRRRLIERLKRSEAWLNEHRNAPLVGKPARRAKDAAKRARKALSARGALGKADLKGERRRRRREARRRWRRLRS